MLGLSGVPAGPVAGSGGSWSLENNLVGAGCKHICFGGGRTSSKSQGQLQLPGNCVSGAVTKLSMEPIVRDMSTVKTAEGSQASDADTQSEGSVASKASRAEAI